MKTNSFQIRAITTYLLCIASLLIALPLKGQVATSPISSSMQSQYPYNMVGRVFAGGSVGSGVAISDRVVLTCAHVFFDSSRLQYKTSAYEWSLRYSSTQTSKITARSYRRFTDYATAVSNSGSASRAAYNLDAFTLIYYQSVANGGHGGYLVSGGNVSGHKTIIGYPSGLYSNNDSRQSTMHAVNAPSGVPATFNLMSGTSRYRETSAMVSGAGNSGGPVYAYYNGNWSVIGIYVSGNASLSGMTEIDSAVQTMIQNSITDSGSSSGGGGGGGGGGDPGPVENPRSFSATDLPKAIPDNNQTGVQSVLNVGLDSTIASATVNVNIRHTWRGDLKVTLFAPDNSFVVLHNRTGDSANDLSIQQFNLPAMVGKRSRGNWRLWVQDLAGGDVGQITNFALSITPVSGTVAQPINTTNFQAYKTYSEQLGWRLYQATYPNNINLAYAYYFYYFGLAAYYEGVLLNDPYKEFYVYNQYMGFYHLYNYASVGDYSSGYREYFSYLAYAAYLYFESIGDSNTANYLYNQYAAQSAHYH